jgi:hypothetical protein
MGAGFCGKIDVEITIFPVFTKTCLLFLSQTEVKFILITVILNGLTLPFN